MSLEENKALVRRSIEDVLISGNVDACDEIYAPDYVSIALWPNARKPESLRHLSDLHLVKAGATMFRAAFPDLSVTIEALIAEADTVISCTTTRGTHTGEPYLGIAPTGLPVEFTGFSIDRIANGRIIESKGLWDRLGAFQQLDLLPDQDAIMRMIRERG